MKITRKKLEGYQKLIKDMEVLRIELYEMNMTDDGLGHSVIMDYRSGFPQPQTVIGFDGDRYRNKRHQLDKKEEDEKFIRNWVENIKEPVIRQVFKNFYIDGLSWMEVAKQTGYKESRDYPRLMIRDKYLKEKKIK